MDKERMQNFPVATRHSRLLIIQKGFARILILYLAVAGVSVYSACLTDGAACRTLSGDEGQTLAGADTVGATNTSGIHLYELIDEFERPDATTLGQGWLDCKTTNPNFFEPLGIHNGGVVVTDPFTRAGTYDSTPPSGHPPTEGRLFPGIGCASVETGASKVSVKIIWSGHHGVEHGPPISHVEGTPLLYVAPDSPRYAFGAWTSQLFGIPVIFAGYIGAPVENFEVVATGRLDEHVSGMPREIELRAEEPGMITVFVDGKQVSFDSGYGLNPIGIDKALIGSTRHGLAVDAHVVDPPTNIPSIKSIEAITISELR